MTQTDTLTSRRNEQGTAVHQAGQQQSPCLLSLSDFLKPLSSFPPPKHTCARTFLFPGYIFLLLPSAFLPPTPFPPPILSPIPITCSYPSPVFFSFLSASRDWCGCERQRPILPLYISTLAGKPTCIANLHTWLNRCLKKPI
jgi:hypothetical protein